MTAKNKVRVNSVDPADVLDAAAILYGLNAMKVRAKQLAFVAVVSQSNGYKLGLAELNCSGYAPLHGIFFTTLDAARLEASKRNAELGLNPDEAFNIVTSSMVSRR